MAQAFVDLLVVRALLKHDASVGNQYLSNYIGRDFLEAAGSFEELLRFCRGSLTLTLSFAVSACVVLGLGPRRSARF